MPYESLRDFIALLESRPPHARVGAGRPHLEMTEIQTRLLRNGGPAVLFEKPVMPRRPIARIPRWPTCSAR